MSIEVEAIAVATYACPRCESQPGHPCQTVSETGGTGEVAEHTHEPRMLGVRAAFTEGYKQGTLDESGDSGVKLVDNALVENIVKVGRAALDAS